MNIWISDDATRSEIKLGEFAISDVREIVSLVKEFGLSTEDRTHKFCAATLQMNERLEMWITTISKDIDGE